MGGGVVGEKERMCVCAGLTIYWEALIEEAGALFITLSFFIRTFPQRPRKRERNCRQGV